MLYDISHLSCSWFYDASCQDAGDGAARDSSSPMAKDKKVAKKKAVEIKWDLVEEKTTKISEENEIKEARRVGEIRLGIPWLVFGHLPPEHPPDNHPQSSTPLGQLPPRATTL